MRVLPAPAPNLGGATGKAAAVSSSVVIKCRQNVAVQIRRVQDRDADGVRLKRGSSTGQRRKSTEQSRATGEFQKVASRPGSIWGRHCKFALREPNGKSVFVAIKKACRCSARSGEFGNRRIQKPRLGS